jgi:flagellar biosynthesis chaperone FliJ
MNKQRGQKIRDVRKEIENCKENLQKILDEAQDYFDNMPENLQGSMRGSDSEDAIDTMESCIENLENIIKELTEI